MGQGSAQRWVGFRGASSEGCGCLAGGEGALCAGGGRCPTPLTPCCTPQTLYTYPENWRAFKALIAAQFSGAKVKVLSAPPQFHFGQTNKTPEFLKKFPVGKVGNGATGGGWDLAGGFARFPAVSHRNRTRLRCHAVLLPRLLALRGWRARGPASHRGEPCVSPRGARTVFVRGVFLSKAWQGGKATPRSWGCPEGGFPYPQSVVPVPYW